MAIQAHTAFPPRRNVNFEAKPNRFHYDKTLLITFSVKFNNRGNRCILRGNPMDHEIVSKRTPRVVLACAAAASLAGCGGGGGGSSSSSSTTSNPGLGNPAFFETGEFLQSEALQQINASEGYARIPGEVGGAGVRVAVLDDGVDADHIDLVDNLVADLIFGGQTEIDNQDGLTPLGINGHGTAVASVIAGSRNGIGNHGVAFNADIVSLDIFTTDNDPNNGDDPTRNLAAGIRAASSNSGLARADIINMSVGFEGSDALAIDVGVAMQEAAAAGRIMVISSGNEGLTDPLLPARFVTASGIAGLGIAVGSVDAGNNLSSFSNACGVSAEFCLVAPGESVDAAFIDDQFGEVDGTSFAAPLVAGSAAVVKSAFPGVGNREVVNRLLKLAEEVRADLGDAKIAGRGVRPPGRIE
jgi:subtilisin family serine protease